MKVRTRTAWPFYGTQIKVHAFRRDELIESTVTLAAPPPLITLAVRGRNVQRSAWLGLE